MPGDIKHLSETMFPVHEADDLLSVSHRRARIDELRTLVSVPAAHFNRLYFAALRSYADYVQLLPASEAHHHAGEGGMLDHGMEVAVMALRLRRAYLLPTGAEPEIIASKAELWSYAVFIAALLHDIGKSLINHRITLHKADGEECGVWNPLAGPMRAVGYKVEFIRDRSYRFHERLPPLVAHHIIPGIGLAWLGSDHEVLSTWLASLSGHHEQAGVLADIVGQADQASVASNLGAGDTSRFSAARQIPLQQKLMTSLRLLLENQVLPLNRNGAAGWLVGDDLWLVSKRTADALRDHLSEEGHNGIPTRNDRLFDVLQEHGILTQNNGQAIWRAEVSGSGWAHVLTLLRIPVSKIWPQESARPVPFDGQVIPREQEPQALDNDEAASQAPSSTQSVQPRSAVAESEKSPVGELTVDLPAVVQSTSHQEDALEQDEGRRFVVWLKASLVERRLKCNQADARIHGVAEGMLLVSPAIFKDYGRTTGDQQAWERAQKRFLKLRLHERAIDGTNIIQYKVELPGGNHNGKAHVIKGIVVNDSSLMGEHAPPPNPLLKRFDP